MDRTVKLLLKSLKGVYIFQAAVTVAESEWLMKGSGSDSERAEWIEIEACEIVNRLKAQLEM